MSYFHIPPQPGLLIIHGDDRADFLQRQTTNDVRLLTRECVVPTVLTDATARVLDVWHLFQFDEDTIGALTLDGRGAQTVAFLKRRIFFNDNVTIEDASDTFGQVIIEGDTLSQLGLPIPEIDQQTRAGDMRIFGQRGVGKTSLRVLLPVAQLEAFTQPLAPSGIRKVDPDQYETLRIRAGIPGPIGELTESYNPLEVGLGYAISHTKGCYTGQEIIARQITYDKITRSLVRVTLDSPAPAGAKISAAGKSAGKLTSIAETADGVFGLAMLKRPHNQPGVAITLGSVEGKVLD